MRGSPAVERPVPPPIVRRRSSLLRHGEGRFLAVLGLALLVLIGFSMARGMTMPRGARPSPTATPDLSPYVLAQPRPAPPLELVSADGGPFALTSLRGEAALVFFGYTHCPDVCPATIGIVGQVMSSIGPGLRAVFVTVDPARDTPESLREYLRYIPKGFSALTGSSVQVRIAADAWGVRYAKIDSDRPGAYGMTHTATVYLVDGAGLIRAEFPFGTQPAPMAQVVRGVMATPVAPVSTATPPPPTIPPTASPAAGPTATPASTPATIAGLRAEVVSTSVWAGGASPLILALYDVAGRVDDLDAAVQVRLATGGGQPAGGWVRATAVRPFGLTEVSYVAALEIATPGWWGVEVDVRQGDAAGVTSITFAVLDPGSTARLGAAAPSAPAARTPTLADVGGNVRELSTDALPDMRLYGTSTAEALAAHRPFVLVIDSPKFKTSPACGKALQMARFLQDRWPDVPFIHVEPFEFDIVSDSQVIVGSLSVPMLVPSADAWGIGGSPWGAASMPWIFVVDGSGIVRAKYQGVIGSADVDVLIALIRAGG